MEVHWFHGPCPYRHVLSLHPCPGEGEASRAGTGDLGEEAWFRDSPFSPAGLLALPLTGCHEG